MLNSVVIGRSVACYGDWELRMQGFSLYTVELMQTICKGVSMRGWDKKGRVEIVLQRVKNFIRGLDESFISETMVMDTCIYRTTERLPLADTIDLPRIPIHEQDHWGDAWDSGYFHLKATVPAAWAGKELAARLSFGGEALIYDRHAMPLYGLTDYSQFDQMYKKQVYTLGAFQARDCIELFVEAAANGLFGVNKPEVIYDRLNSSRHGTWDGRLVLARLGIFDINMWSLMLDMKYLLNLYESLDSQSVRAVRILGSLFEATVVYEDHGATAARIPLGKELHKPAQASSLSTTVVGHAHIDSAWLWPLAETRRKVARTFASQLDLLNTYPEFIFGASAPQHYAWVKEDHPALYAKIKQAVASGRWELQGGMWIEPDCNLVCGESLVRQILHGKDFFLQEFGVEVKTCWIPDVFGYPASMPQILQKAGLPYFLTQKMSWSKHNVFPYDSFIWQGIDGSTVITHFLPEHDYNSSGKPGALRKAEDNFHEKDRLDEFMTLLGIGDGGGGPQEEHVEYVLRSADTESVPRASFGTSEVFFERLQSNKSLLETYPGELYLEYHRGTYTSQAKVKKANRLVEDQLRQVEALLCCLPSEMYPHAELANLMQAFLTLQFHDILPGSSIHLVYEDAHRMYAEILATLAVLRQRAQSTFCTMQEKSVVIFNVLQTAGNAVVRLPSLCAGASLSRVGKNCVPTQIVTDWKGSEQVYAEIDLPSQGWVTLEMSGIPDDSHIVEVSPQEPLVLENNEVRYRFSPSGFLVEALFVPSGMSCMPQGKVGNSLIWYHDYPHTYEAWDIDYYYTQQEIGVLAASSWERIADGPVLFGIRFHYSFGNSHLVQDVLLARNGKALNFVTHVEWQETRKLLRVAFPVNPLAEAAVCDIPFGSISRSTKVRTEWDFAKFEFCARRYVDVYHDGKGVALLNDCKYGYSCRDGALGLSLLRAPLNPDPDADIGFHEFTYVFLPHEERLEDSEVLRMASLLNCPPLIFPASVVNEHGCACLPLYIEGEGCSVEALKMTLDGKSRMIRVVESYGRTCHVTLHSTTMTAAVVETDLLERPLEGAVHMELPCTVELQPFEIRTFREV